jgi:hypothetical protein
VRLLGDVTTDYQMYCHISTVRQAMSIILFTTRLGMAEGQQAAHQPKTEYSFSLNKKDI